MNSRYPEHTLRLAAPAKINLFLHITGRRDDGYHLLESVFVPISLADTVQLTRREDGEICLLDPPDGITSDTDLTCRAARALCAETGSKFGVDIRLTKRIPQGAGLGGGSSDAATALLGLNRLWNLQLSSERILSIALNLGADVPFFIRGVPALVSGIGERIRAVTLPVQHIVVAHPGVPVSTAAVFGHPQLIRDSAASQAPIFTLSHGQNDMQAAAQLIEPAVSALCDSMRNIGLKPRMSGSGSAVFALQGSAETACRAASKLREMGVSAWAVQTLNQHPLHADFGAAII
ncbi:MAG: 4-(cytidine 5'-diphospho)-2-C-methyl-D-erythritol kinase [Betaproteobacteria bacterium]|nr:MAG: 4-(cytidine 5'-diphospho)-2-C-methyl-D-erythritol kinase [Betaproteobacteria bacterium]